MQKILIGMFLVGFLFANSMLFSEESTTNNFYPPHGFGLEFGLSGLFNFTNYSGNNLIAGKYQMDNNSAIRLGFSGAFNTTSGTQTYTNNFVSSTGTSNFTKQVTNSSSSMTIGINADYQYYINPSDIIKAYVGIGPTFSIGYNNKVYSDVFFDNLETSNYTNSSYSWSIGARVCLGVEWFATKNLSLFAEYGLVASYTQNFGNSTIVDLDTSNSTGVVSVGNGITINPLNIQLGIAAYF